MKFFLFCKILYNKQEIKLFSLNLNRPFFMEISFKIFNCRKQSAETHSVISGFRRKKKFSPETISSGLEVVNFSLLTF